MKANDALLKLREGNRRFVSEVRPMGDYSAAQRKKLAEEGQRPYVAILACADSRVVPERIFDAGLGELFVVRAAGNHAAGAQLASLQYATAHLGCKLVLILGHTGCGAISAALKGEEGEEGGELGALLSAIRRTFGGERDAAACCRRNVEAGVRTVKEAVWSDVCVLGALYHTDSGTVTFFE